MAAAPCGEEEAGGAGGAPRRTPAQGAPAGQGTNPLSTNGQTAPEGMR